MPVKKEITFKDLDGNDVTEEFWFNITKAEVAELEVEVEGGMSVLMSGLAEVPTNGAKVMQIFKILLTKAVGKRSENARRLIKDDEVRADFFQSLAYDELFGELVTNADYAGEFITAVLPQDMEAFTAKIEANDQKGKDANGDQPAWVAEGRVPTPAELVGAPPNLIQEAFRRQAAASKS